EMLFDAVVPIQLVEGEIAEPEADLGRVGDEIEAFFLLAKSFLGLLALGDVAGHGELRDAAVGAKKRSGMRFHMAAFAIETNHVELERAAHTAADALVEGTELVTMLGCDEAVDVLAQHRFGRARSQHAQAG